MTSQSSSPTSSIAPSTSQHGSGRGSEVTTEGIRITVKPAYLPFHSKPFENQFIFQYQICISNESTETVTLRSRYWQIIDEDGNCEEVEGAGVIGMQPRLQPGESFEYESFCPLPTRWGTMEGTYFFEREADGKVIKAAVARFYLVAPVAMDDDLPDD